MPRIRLKYEVARQPSNHSLCSSVGAVPGADEAEQQLSRLAPSACELSADVRIFGAGLRKEPARDPHPQVKIEVLRGKTSKQPQSLCLCASTAMGT